jgi:short-subunit dehydrogenase
MGEKRSGSGHTRLYKLGPKIGAAAAVARAGYEGIKRGSTVMIPGRWNKLIAFVGELPPRRIALEVSRWLLGAHS